MKIKYVVKHICSDEKLDGSVEHKENTAVSKLIEDDLAERGYTPKSWTIEEVNPVTV